MKSTKITAWRRQNTNKLVKIFIIIITGLIVLPFLLLVTSEVPDWVVLVPEDSKSQLIGKSIFEERVGEKASFDWYGLPEDEVYFVEKIAFVILRDLLTQEVKRITGKTEQDEIGSTLANVNKHVRNALEITTQHIQSKTDTQYIVNNIVIGATPLGDFSEIYESVEDTTVIIKANREIENALSILQNSAPFNAQSKDNKPYKFEANLIAIQAAQYFKYKNDPYLVKYFLDWESNFNVIYDSASTSYQIRKSIESGKKLGLTEFYVQVKCPYPQEGWEYCYGFVGDLGRLEPMFVSLIQLKRREDILRIASPLYISTKYNSGELEYYTVGFSQESLFEPVLGVLQGQEVKEILQMKQYTESKQRDEIPVIQQRISDLQKKLYVPWQPYTIPEPKIKNILDDFSDLQKRGLQLSEFNESKIRKNSSGEYIYMDEISRIQAFSKLLKSTPTSNDFEKYYENRLLTIKRDLNELENKYSSESFVTLQKIMNFYNR